MSIHRLIHGDCLKVLESGAIGSVNCIFADPPDNIGLFYCDGKDLVPDCEYLTWLGQCIRHFLPITDTLWLSFNAKWMLDLSCVLDELIHAPLRNLEARFCIQTFTFGQHRQTDLGYGYRPLLRLRYENAPIYPDQVRVPSWRQEHGDKRADPRGRVPSDVFNFPRVTGNSQQRRTWHPTQLHEGLIERCIKLSTKEGDVVLDPFAGTGTTLRVCKRINRSCILIEKNAYYCEKLAEEHGLLIAQAE